MRLNYANSTLSKGRKAYTICSLISLKKKNTPITGLEGLNFNHLENKHFPNSHFYIELDKYISMVNQYIS